MPSEDFNCPTGARLGDCGCGPQAKPQVLWQQLCPRKGRARDRAGYVSGCLLSGILFARTVMVLGVTSRRTHAAAEPSAAAVSPKQ